MGGAAVGGLPGQCTVKGEGRGREGARQGRPQRPRERAPTETAQHSAVQRSTAQRGASAHLVRHVELGLAHHRAVHVQAAGAHEANGLVHAPRQVHVRLALVRVLFFWVGWGGVGWGGVGWGARQWGEGWRPCSRQSAAPSSPSRQADQCWSSQPTQQQPGPGAHLHELQGPLRHAVEARVAARGKAAQQVQRGRALRGRGAGGGCAVGVRWSCTVMQAVASAYGYKTFQHPPFARQPTWLYARTRRQGSGMRADASNSGPAAAFQAAQGQPGAGGRPAIHPSLHERNPHASRPRLRCRRTSSCRCHCMQPGAPALKLAGAPLMMSPR